MESRTKNEKGCFFTVRQSLSGLSLIGQCLEAAHYKVDPPGHAFAEQAYRRMVKAARAGDLASLYRDTIVFAHSPYHNLIAVDVDMSNLQFFGAALYEPAFAHGYEPDILSALDLFNPKDGILYDIGSNWGYISLHCLLDPAFTGRVIAVEPVADSLNALRRFADILGFKDRLTMLPIAAGDRNGQSIISREAQSGLNSLLGDTSGGDRVDVARLDGLDLPLPTFVKMDVEGYEAQALSGMSGIITQSKPIIMFENWFDPANPEPGLDPIRIALGYGYHLYAAHFAPEAGYSAVIPFDAKGTLELTPLTCDNRGEFLGRLNILAHPDRLA